MAKRKRRLFTPEFKADAVKVVQAGRSAGDVARELDRTMTPPQLRFASSSSEGRRKKRQIPPHARLRHLGPKPSGLVPDDESLAVVQAQILRRLDLERSAFEEQGG